MQIVTKPINNNIAHALLLRDSMRSVQNRYKFVFSKARIASAISALLVYSAPR